MPTPKHMMLTPKLTTVAMPPLPSGRVNILVRWVLGGVSGEGKRCQERSREGGGLKKSLDCVAHGRSIYTSWVGESSQGCPLRPSNALLMEKF